MAQAQKTDHGLLTVKGTVRCTPEHPFYVEGRGFVKAGELGIGNSIVTRAGPSVEIEKIEQRDEPVTVFNFEVADFHTYFVGKSNDGLWVHNVCPLVAGEDLGPVMSSTGLQPTQANVSAAKVNEYANDMEAGTWDWSLTGSQNPIIIDSAGNIMAGHHRLVAAQRAGVQVPESAITRYPDVTYRPPRNWEDVVVDD